MMQPDFQIRSPLRRWEETEQENGVPCLLGKVNVLPSPAQHRDEPRWQLPGGCERQLRVRFSWAAGTARRGVAVRAAAVHLLAGAGSSAGEAACSAVISSPRGYVRTGRGSCVNSSVACSGFLSLQRSRGLLVLRSVLGLGYATES